jgi:TM2 domain-containing membrane protein YozV
MNLKTFFLLSSIILLLTIPFLKGNKELNKADFQRTSRLQKQQSEVLNFSEYSYRDADFKILKRMLMSKCNVENCFPDSGICKGEKCFCLEGFLTVPMKGDHRSCNYQQKKIIYSLLLESFGFIGFGHIYAGRYFNGFLKLIWFFVNIFYGVQFVMVLMKENSDTDAAYYIKMLISLACVSVPILWHFIDLYKFSNNLYFDGNNLPMHNW